MGSFSHGIADAIRRMGDAQVQGALQKGAVYGNLAHDLGQAPMQYLAIDRGLHENQYRQTMQAAQEKKLKDDQEFEALINQTPPGPERLKVSLEFWQGRDPEKYHALVTGAYQAATQAVGAQQGRPGEPKLTPDPVSGEPTQIDQQTAHAPVQFPGAYGQEPFSVTPLTDTQVQSAANQQSGLKAFIEAKMKAAGTVEGEAGKPQSWAPDTIVKLPGQEAFQLPGRQTNPADNPTPYKDFRSGDPTKRQNAEDFMSQSKDPEMVALRKALMQKTLEKPERDPTQPTPYQKTRTEFDLRKEFNNSPIVKEYDNMRKQLARVESAMEQAKTSKNFVAIDQALINGLNKMIDPQSVVREGEYARTIENSPLFSRMVGKIDQIRSGGGGFTNEERTALVSLMREFYKDAEGLYSNQASEYERLAEGAGIDKNRIVIQRDKIGPSGSSGGGPKTAEEFLKSIGK